MLSDNATKAQSIEIPEVSRKLFGGVLVYDGAGHYPGLELLNLVFGSRQDQLLPAGDNIRFRRHAHEMARMLAWAEDQFQKRQGHGDEIVYNRFSEDALRHMLECVKLDIPSSRSNSTTWERSHFFPYTRSLIHWDARLRGKKVLIERRYLRGGGALAFKLLRTDPDFERLSQNRAGFEALFSRTKDSSLERLAATLREKGTSDPEDRSDEIETLSEVRNDDLDSLYRSGVRNILSHEELASVVRLRTLMSWTGFWLVLAQHVRAADYLEVPNTHLICDCSDRQPQLRRASQRYLREKQALIMDAAEQYAAVIGKEVVNKAKQQLRGFFWATAATIGLLNAWTGRRHFTLRPALIETLVMASEPSGSQQVYEEFLDQFLYQKCRLVIGRNAAEAAGLLSSIDASIFEDNENQFARRLSACGFLEAYSDATRMVRSGAGS